MVLLALAGEFVPLAVNVSAAEASETVRPFLALAERVTDRALLGRHYRHVGLQQLATKRLSLKRFFYALRPAAVFRSVSSSSCLIRLRQL